PDWLRNLVSEFNDGIVGVGGGTRNIGRGVWGRSIGFVLDTFLGSADSVQDRVLPDKRIVPSISGCNSMFRRSDLLSIGNFNPALSMNEDTDICRRLQSIGRLCYTPDAIVLHNQDRSLKEFARRIYLFGKGRAKNRLWDIKVVPPIMGLLFVVVFPIFPYFLLAGIMVYIALLLSFDIAIFVREKKASYLLTVPLIFMIEHGSYILGFWSGILESMRRGHA
ncbi:MAG TPA: hypothetical protein VE134_08220, partial [Methanomicrobiales archaeon]|nr:hypothetical protein [Methanomicrobiales archaeon]